MRAYLEKPRSRSGWKGLLSDPRLDESHRLDEGLVRGRKLLVELNAMGVPCATELLGLLTPPYIEDLLVWGALGARTTESQPHRELFSACRSPSGSRTRRTARSAPRSTPSTRSACRTGSPRSTPTVGAACVNQRATTTRTSCSAAGR